MYMEQKNHRSKKTMDCICKMEKKDLNNPKKVHRKHKIRRFFWKSRGQKLSVGIKKSHQNGHQKKEESKGGKIEDVFLSPV